MTIIWLAILLVVGTLECRHSLVFQTQRGIEGYFGVTLEPGISQLGLTANAITGSLIGMTESEVGISCRHWDTSSFAGKTDWSHFTVPVSFKTTSACRGRLTRFGT